MLPNLDNVTIWAYDLTKFGADTIVDVIRAHPAVLIGDTLRKNPFYTHLSH